MDLKETYKRSLFIRTFEHKLIELYKKGLIHGTLHLSIGQEYIPVIVSHYLTQSDSVTSTHRGHAHALAKELDATLFLAELMGKGKGYCGGKGGTQHTLSEAHNFYANGITGGMVPIGNGLAFANKHQRTGNIVVSYLGDGAMNEGYVMEALNMAVVLELPILFVCENNTYAMGTHSKYTHSFQIMEKVKGFGISCHHVPDNDYIKLDKTVKTSTQEVREKSRPQFIEVMTYRHFGHSINDLNLYRDKTEEKDWMSKDALNAMRAQLLRTKSLNEEQLADIHSECSRVIDKITNDVLDMPDSSQDVVSDHIYSP